jgi:FkbM family methyltransferase
VTFISYAQNFEDVLLWRALGQIQHGHYIDIGAQDPVVDSVSLAFYEAGWRGIHVEPAPSYASKLREARPDEIVIEAVVTDVSGPVPFFEFPGTGISTGRADIATRHSKIGYEARNISLPAIRLDEVLEMAPSDPHWMKIDVEGMESDVLRSWGESKRRPWILVIESTFPTTQEETYNLWIQEVLARGYKKVFFDGLSCYFVHQRQRALAARFKTPANVFDGFAVARHHFSAAEIGAQLDATKQRLDVEWARAEGLQSTLTEAVSARDKARDEQREALQRMVLSEKEHRASIETLAEKQRVNELELRREFRDLEEGLRKRAVDAEETLAGVRVEMARLQERATQLETQLECSDRAASKSKSEYLKELSRVRGESDQLRAQWADRRRRYEDELRELRSTSANSEALLRMILAERPSRWQQVGEALGLAKRGSARHELENWVVNQLRIQSVATDDQQLTKEEEIKVAMQTNVLNEEPVFLRQAVSVEDLLATKGRDFVRLAYATILGRQTDTEGESYYLDRLNRGFTKIELLDQLRKGDEAKLMPRLPGLDATLRKFRLFSLGMGKRSAGARIERDIVRRATEVHVDDFMRYHDAEFVAQVFAYYLGRAPDEAGLAHYLRRIRSGVSRQQILLEVLRGAEAKRRGKHAVGETAIAMALFIDRVPVIRELVTMIKFNLNLRNHLQDMRARENHLYRLSKNLH